MEIWKKFFDEGSKLTNEIFGGLDKVKETMNNSLKDLAESTKECKGIFLHFMLL